MLGALALFAVLALRRDPLKPTPFVPTLVMGLLQTTGFTLLQTIAVAHGGAGKATILAYTMPFWTVLLAWPLLGERVAGVGWVALACAAAGLAFVLAPFDSHALVPDLLAIGAGLSWAASAVWSKLVRARYRVELLPLAAWQMVWGAIPMIVVTALLPEHVRPTPSFIAAIAYMSFAGMALGWVMWMFVLHRLPAGVAGIASLAVPVVAVLSAALQLHEIPSRTEIAGMVLIVGALVLNSLPRDQKWTESPANSP